MEKSGESIGPEVNRVENCCFRPDRGGCSVRVLVDRNYFIRVVKVKSRFYGTCPAGDFLNT